MPTDIALTNHSIEENQPTGQEVGTFSATDEDAKDTHSFVLATGNGTNDSGNSSFMIDGNVLKTNAVFDYEEQKHYNIYVQAVDALGATAENAFVIEINDLTETAINRLDSEVFTVYPNPAKEYVYVHMNEKGLLPGYQIQIFNQSGISVFETEVVDRSYEIDVSDWGASGLYFIQIIDGQGELVSVRKIVVR